MDNFQFAFETEVVTVFPGTEQLKIRRVKDSYSLVQNMSATDFGPDERMPYWADLWPSSIALARYLTTENKLKNFSVMELGCGLGLAGIAAAKQGAVVTLTDYFQDALLFAAENARLNAVALQTFQMDWREINLNKKFDFLIGADILYEARNHEPVLEAISQILAPGGKAILTDPSRVVTRNFPDFARSKGIEVEFFFRHLSLADAMLLPPGMQPPEILFMLLHKKTAP